MGRKRGIVEDKLKTLWQDLDIEEQATSKKKKKNSRNCVLGQSSNSVTENTASLPGINTASLLPLSDNPQDANQKEIIVCDVGAAESSCKKDRSKVSKKRKRVVRTAFSGLVDESFPSISSSEAVVLPFTHSCQHCKAKRFHLEPKGFCCSDGDVSLSLSSSPHSLWDLYTSSTDSAKEFQAYVRTYNNAFAFTSLGVKYDRNLCKKNKGIYTFRAQGQAYHYINELLPFDNQPSYLQLYFYDTEHEIQNRLNTSNRLNANTIALLIDILNDNPYCSFFRSLQNFDHLEEHFIVIKSNADLDQRVYNVPTSSQIAAIWTESEGGELCSTRDIIVHAKPGSKHKVQYYFGCYDPLQYPLLFPYGESGWHEGIERIKKQGQKTCDGEFSVDVHQARSVEQLLSKESAVYKLGKQNSRNVAMREYYCYLLQIRPQSSSILMHSGRFLQQYVVDMYIKIESSRLDYYRLHQREIRADNYQGIVDSIVAGESHGCNIGKRIVLPGSFIGGPRDMRRRYVDAMSLVQRFGKPDLFITMTCNPSWLEIKQELLPGEEAQNRPDLVARVFRSKLELLKEDLFKKQIFGPVAAYVYVVEFQKRGLPHVHFLIILAQEAKIRSPDLYDRYVSAEIPKRSDNIHLHTAVWKHMMHGPCGIMNPNNICMKKDGSCKNRYPKDFSERTSQTNDSYPIYRRRDNQETLDVRGHMLDNRWVIPYNPYLLAKYDCHINVEICSTIKAVKYLYKYIYKGHDRVSFNITAANGSTIIDEIEMFQSARWVSPPEAMWRIYRFTLNETFPAVINLQLHLEDQQNISFRKTDDLRNVVGFPPLLKTMLTEYFSINKTNVEAKQYLYRDFPQHFVWNQQDRMWQTRKQGVSIGRIVTANPSEGERYYLRLLLNNIKGCTSFEDLKLIGAIQAKTFRESALLHNLLQADNSLELCLEEASYYQMPSTLRRLFATLLVYCNPSNARALWEQFQVAMCEDFQQEAIASSNSMPLRALQDISLQLESMGKKINDYGLIDDDIIIEASIIGSREIDEELRIIVLESDLQSITALNFEQRNAFETISERVVTERGGAFFIDGPGGTGKTFLYRALLASIRSRKHIALATASSGVAASILPGGRTAHSRFKIPVSSNDKFGCTVSKQSGLAKLLRAAKLIIWDEAPMVKRQAIEAFEQMLRDVCDSNLPFGNKVVVFGGDFRQVLPVVPRGTMEQTISSSLVKSNLWPVLEKIKLTENMRAKLDHDFSSFLLRVGDGNETLLFDEEIQIPASMIVPYTNDESLTDLIDVAFPNIDCYPCNIESMINRAILTPKNDSVDTINNILITKFPGELQIYNSFDETIENSKQGLQEDFFNTLTPSGYPPHTLQLKKNCPIILLRNIDPFKGLCNGTRLICKSFQRNMIDAEIAIGQYKGKRVFLPRVPLLPSEDESMPFPFKRTQFPIRLCFAMTINKAQGQTLDFVAVYFPQPVFSHGQLYVALSRAKASSFVKILVESFSDKPSDLVHTRNIVYKEVLLLAESCTQD